MAAGMHHTFVERFIVDIISFMDGQGVEVGPKHDHLLLGIIAFNIGQHACASDIFVADAPFV